ncbi:DoxX family protein [Flagellimonas zhangzhouensis]|uniref:Putative oxidoreductase n=1 Tax=Flagellimonas zhangzhouensis TaxID=1073328 RepID=A0A1H2SBM1_9FLAO|nr:DoxX family protein [Allomuricauda zhangzhouensis]SDQ73023.1 putative oxidoreductase [Allomuricauda zhangzhouensis]SDW28990.1 putative oxidoreductase [Allomuricauda zhangzhouensis]
MKNTPTVHIGLALLRIVPSAFMISHGYGKLMNLISGNTEFANPFGIGQAPSLFLAVIGEVICPLLIIIGFKTRWAAIPAAITMFVAAFMIHAADPFGTKEKALLYLVIFIAIMLLGPGKYSVDKK